MSGEEGDSCLYYPFSLFIAQKSHKIISKGLNERFKELVRGIYTPVPLFSTYVLSVFETG